MEWKKEMNYESQMTEKCEHDNLIPHVVWNTGSWFWTCSKCYSRVSNDETYGKKDSEKDD